MPKKPKPKKVNTTVIVNGVPIAVTLHPPTATRKSWYAYWSGLTYAKSTGCADLEDAFVAVQRMVTNGGQKPSVKETLLSDEEFSQIQHRHFSKKNDPAARKRAEKSLTACMEAITAF